MEKVKGKFDTFLAENMTKKFGGKSKSYKNKKLPPTM